MSDTQVPERSTRNAPERALGLCALALLCACRGSPSDSQLRRAATVAEEMSNESGLLVVDHVHRGPPVAAGDSGPARWVPLFLESYGTEMAFEIVKSADRWYRGPANEGYDETLDAVTAHLREAGFGTDARLVLEIFESEPERPPWTPLRGKLVLRAPGSEPRVLHAFEAPEDSERLLLPQNAPAAQLDGPVALDLASLQPGAILVTKSPLRRDVVNRAALHGAVGVVSASLASYNVDPSGAERHLDAIQYRVLRFVPELPVAQISPRSYEAIASAVEAGGEVRIALEGEVAFSDRPLRTLVATVIGSERPEEAVVVASHVQEPGACDNASGVAGLAESAAMLGRLLRDERLAWPRCSVAFVWGDEMVQSRIWFERSGRRAIAGISSDMTGQSREKTGAIPLLERMPDPGAVLPLPPDEHTPWGESPVEAGSLAPNGLAVIARCALADVGQRVGGGWETREHPWEGGSDHDVFIQEHGVPAVLFWHFTDFAYHTSLDRLAHVDPEEMRRTAVAILATALAVADARPTDLERYLDSLRIESGVRLAACADAQEEEIAELWRAWVKGARMWLRALCLGLPLEAAQVPERVPEDDGQ